jgi:hypothetical protein
MRILFFAFFLLMGMAALAQNNSGYWQQRVEYKMEIDVNVDNHQYKGKQELKYINNSPDTLYRVFYHLYFNAFQPGSEMDSKSMSQYGSDRRLAKGEINVLSEEEIGFIKVSSLTQNGIEMDYKTVGTILEVNLNKPILPGQTTFFNMAWDAQIPVQIRRSGRNNAEGVAYSMSQWYPKLAEYDFEGWHADPYIDREFHGVWGDFDVKINIDKDYTIGGTGYLQNPNEVGHGYQNSEQKTIKSKDGKNTWHFFAPDVHDFAWAADNEFIHDVYPGPNNVELHFFYKNNPEILENWKNLQKKTAELMAFFNEAIGDYPYKQYSVVQGGDGGMEYPMCTLITGVRSFNSLVGVTSHELAHSWFHGVLATNESKHEWMDEGFASYISGWAMNSVMEQNKENPTASAYMNYKYMAIGGKEQPLTTHADRYSSGQNYAVNAYSKGAVFLAQLGYVIGKENLNKTLKRYYSEFKFKHPTPNDFIRVAEKVSGFELDWYLTDWTQTTNTIDYGIMGADSDGTSTVIVLERKGLMPMPVDVMVTYMDGSSEFFYIPLQMMRAEKSSPYSDVTVTVLDDWAWAYPEYRFTIPNSKQIKKIEIDPSKLMADIHLGNNVFNME